MICVMRETPLRQERSVRWKLAFATIGATVVFAALLWLLDRLLGIGHPMFSFCVQFGLMGCSSIVLEVGKPDLRSSWFHPRPFENGGRIYRKLGVRVFQTVLRRIGWERITRGHNARFGRGRETASVRERESRGAEFAHLVGILAFPPLAVWMIAAGEPWSVGYLAGWTLVLQVYPVMLQRYNRPRYRRVVDWQAQGRAAGP
jgi:hypothetical protein